MRVSTIPQSVMMTLVAAAIAVCTASPAPAATVGASPAAVRQGPASRPAAPQAAATVWAEMDYGPFMSMTLEAPQPKANFAYKGIVIPLKPDRSAAMVFDTDLLRWAAGWRSGGGKGGFFIDWHNILYDGSHVTHCRIAGDQVFGTAKSPGWAKPGTDAFDDARELPFGPLPREWAQWKGLYRHGDHIALSYRIGDADVLESAELIEHNGISAFARRMRIGTHKTALLASITDTLGALVDLRCAARDGAELVRNGEHVRLRIPPNEEPVDLVVIIAADTADRAADFKRLVADTSPSTSFAHITQGGPARFKPHVTKTEPGKPRPGAAFVVDTLSLPDDNPWRARVRPSGIDFFKGGRRAAICTWDGDVWIVDGILGSADGAASAELTWTRFATGLFQPLGLVIRDDVVYVLGRDQITRLHDLNHDGEADWYECFNHDAQVTEHFHEFAMDLQLAPAGPNGGGGDFYYMKGACHAKEAEVPQHGTLIRVSADGSRSEIVCWGFRAPNGLAISRDGRQFFTTDQQGHWTPANRVNLIEPGKFYGYNLAYLPRTKPEAYEPPIVWLHPKFDRSPAEPFFVDSDRWGALNGKLLLTSYGTGAIELVMTETVDGHMQGGVVKLELPSAPTGIMRSRYNPADGQLYACGLFGWAGDRTRAGGLYRIRYTGQPLRMPIELHAVTSGVILTFSDPLDERTASDKDNYAVSRWNYKRTANYGSPDLRVSDGKAGQEAMTIESVRVSKDRKTVELKLADMRPAMQMQIQYNLPEEGTVPALRGEIQSTVHALADPATHRKLFE